jgi:hypothetical protein
VAGTYVPGGIVDLSFPIAYVLSGLAGISQAQAVKNGQYKDAVDHVHRYGQLIWPLYLPYLLAGGAFAMLVRSHDQPFGLSFVSLSWAVAAIIGMVIIRQVLALNENARLYREAQLDIMERKLAQKEIIRLNEELERRVNSGELAVAFALYPTSIEELLSIADAGKIPVERVWSECRQARYLLLGPVFCEIHVAQIADLIGSSW